MMPAGSRNRESASKVPRRVTPREVAVARVRRCGAVVVCVLENRVRHCGAALRRTCAGAYAMGPGGSSPPRAVAPGRPRPAGRAATGVRRTGCSRCAEAARSESVALNIILLFTDQQ